MGVEAAGIVEAVGEGVTNVAPGDRVTYTGFVNTLGAYSTERIIPAAPLIKLPAAISCETAAAMTMRGLTSAYLHAPHLAARAPATRSCCTPRRAASASSSRSGRSSSGLNVIGTVSTEAKAAVARAHGCDHVILYGREDVAKRVREITDGVGRLGRLRQRGQGHLRGLARFAQAPRPAGLRGHGLGPDPADRRDAARDQGIASS